VISAHGVPVTSADAVALADSAGVCVRPVVRRVTDRETGEGTSVAIPCGSTRQSRCPACSARARRLRVHQCREGWHLAEDPSRPEPDGEDGSGDGDQGAGGAAGQGERRARSTRRADVPDLPRVAMADRTTGAVFTDPKTGRRHRPSMFVTLTLPGYGRVRGGAPVSPGTYDYRRAALDAIHFPKVVDRFWQNLRRCAGFRVQYFAAVEPQKRLAPHLHAAIRGAVPRATIKAVVAATYAHVWWPAHGPTDVRHDGGDRAPFPVWDDETRAYRDALTGDRLTTWEQALDVLDADPGARPAHTVRLGPQIDVKGLVGGTPDTDRAVNYLCKYLTKSVADVYSAGPHTEPDTAYERHIDRLHEHIRWLPCTPGCGNWLRFGVEPKDPGPGMVPGQCPGKAHERECLGLGGRRVLVSRAWTGKTLTAHRADRADVVRQVLQAAGIEPPEARRAAADVLAADGRPRYVWEDVPLEEREYIGVILASVREHRARRTEHEHAKTLAQQRGSPPVDTLSATTPPTTDERAA
jgi:hypothetical protein